MSKNKEMSQEERQEMATAQANSIAADVVEAIEEHDTQKKIDLLWDRKAGEDYGVMLGVKVVMEIWARIGASQTVLDKERTALFVIAAYNFVERWPDAGDEALEIELKPWFDRLLGEGEDPKAFRRLMAARLIKLMIVEFQRALDEEARRAGEVREEPAAARVMEADEVGYLPDDDSGLSEMGQRAAASG